MNITGDDPALVQPIPWATQGSHPGRFSALQADDLRLVLSALTRAQDGGGLVVRYLNLSDESVRARVSSYWPLADAWLAGLNEQPLEKLPLVNEQIVEIEARGWQAVTLLLRFRGINPNGTKMTNNTNVV